MKVAAPEILDMKELMQHKWLLYGVCGNMVKLGALISGKTMVVEAIEDPDNGLKHVQAYREEPPNTTFPEKPIATVTVRDVEHATGSGEFEGWKLIDEQGYVWLEMGTQRDEDLSPSFQFTWHSKAPNMPHTMPQFDPFDL